MRPLPLQHRQTYPCPSLSLLFNFTFSESPHIYLFLNEINQPLLVKSLIKHDALNLAQAWPSAQISTAKTNDPDYVYSNLSPFHSLSFLVCLFSKKLFLIFIFFIILSLFPIKNGILYPLSVFGLSTVPLVLIRQIDK